MGEKRMFGKQKILIVDDDENIAELISLYLTKECFDTKLVYDGEDALAAFDSYQPNLILLDLMLPGIDGYQVCREIRSKAATPIIMLSAKSEDYDKIGGLGAGADDYVTKPFGMMELVSRIKAVLRRTQKDTQDPQDVIVLGDIEMNTKKHEVTADGEVVTLTLKEYELLKRLMKNPNIVMTRDCLLEDIWGYDFDGETRTVDVHVRTLRQKLGKSGEKIETVRGVGYRMSE